MSKQNYFYCLNYFLNRKESGSFFLKTNKKFDSWDDDGVTNEALMQGVITPEDVDQIVDVNEIEEQDFNDAMGHPQNLRGCQVKSCQKNN